MFSITIQAEKAEDLKEKIYELLRSLPPTDIHLQNDGASPVVEQKERKPRKTKEEKLSHVADVVVEEGNAKEVTIKPTEKTEETKITYAQVKDITLELAKSSRAAALGVLGEFKNKKDGTACKLANELSEEDWQKFVELATQKLEELKTEVLA